LFLGNETSICTIITATIFVHLIPSRNKGIGMFLFERKGQLTLLFGSYSRKSKKSGVRNRLIFAFGACFALYLLGQVTTRVWA
jgi:hypothetical protein